MPQKQNLFPENNISKQTAAAYPFQKSGDLIEERGKVEETALMLMNGSNGETIKYFDLVTENTASKSFKSEAFRKTGAKNFTGIDRNKKSGIAASRYFLPLAAAASDDSQGLFDILLVYLDQIVYIKEMSENLRKLDVAVKAGKIDEVNLFAHNCVTAGAHCGMLASVEMLRRLEHVKDAFQLPDAARLCRQIRLEFERFRFNLKENLEQMATDKQRRSLN